MHNWLIHLFTNHPFKVTPTILIAINPIAHRHTFAVFRVFLLFLNLSAVTALYCQEFESIRSISSIEYQTALSEYESRLLPQTFIHVQKALEQFPHDIAGDRAELLLALAEFQREEIENSFRRLERFAKLRNNSPFKPFSTLLLAQISLSKLDFNKSQKLFRLAKEQAETDFLRRADTSYRSLAHSSAFWWGISAGLYGNYDDARRALKEVVAGYKNYQFTDDALFWLGMFAEQSMEYDTALYYFSRLRTEYSASNLSMAGRIREAQTELSVRDATAAIAILSGSDLATIKSPAGEIIQQDLSEHAQEERLYIIGEALAMRGLHRQSFDNSVEFFSRYPTSPFTNQVRLSAGINSIQLGEFKRAVSFFDSLSDISSPEQSRITALGQLYRALALKRDGQRDQATKELTLLSLSSAYQLLPHALLELGQMQYEDGQFLQAKKTLERAERESSDASTAIKTKILLGMTLSELKTFDHAVRVFGSALSMSTNASPRFVPQREQFICTIRLHGGIACAGAEQYKSAIEYLTAFLASKENDSLRFLGLFAREDEAVFWLAESFYRLDLLTNAEENYRAILDRYGSSSRREEAMYGLGWTLFRKKNFSSATDVFGRLTKDFPTTRFAVEVYARLGDANYITKNYRASANAYRSAFDRGKKSDEGKYAGYQLAQALYRLGSFDEATSALRTFLKTYAGTSLCDEAQYLIGWIAFQQKKFSESIKEFQLVIKTYSQSPLVARAHYAIGDAYYNLGSFDMAVESYRTVAKQFPSSPYAPEAVKSLQFALLGMGQDSLAIAVADEFISANPTSPASQELKLKKAEIFYSGRNFKSAAGEYEDFLKRYPANDKNDETTFLLGKTYVSLNDVQQATRVFEDVVKKYPSSEFAPMSLLELGLLQLATANGSKADSIFLSLERRFPNNSNSARSGYERALYYRALGDTAKCLNTLRMVMTRWDSTAYGQQCRYQVAMDFRAKFQDDSARIHFAVLTTIDDNQQLAAEAQYRIGELSYRAKDWKSAIVEFNIVREKFSGFEDWYTLSLLSLGESYDQLGDNAHAKEVYQAVVTLHPDPDDSYGKTAMSRLKRK